MNAAALIENEVESELHQLAGEAGLEVPSDTVRSVPHRLPEGEPFVFTEQLREEILRDLDGTSLEDVRKIAVARSQAGLEDGVPALAVVHHDHTDVENRSLVAE